MGFSKGGRYKLSERRDGITVSNVGRGLLKWLVLCFNVTVSSLKERVDYFNNYCTYMHISQITRGQLTQSQLCQQLKELFVRFYRVTLCQQL